MSENQNIQVFGLRQFDGFQLTNDNENYYDWDKPHCGRYGKNPEQAPIYKKLECTKNEYSLYIYKNTPRINNTGNQSSNITACWNILYFLY